jgi:hypothetical protein
MGGRDESGAYAPSLQLDVDCLTECKQTELDFTVNLQFAVSSGNLEQRAIVTGIAEDGSLHAVAVEHGRVEPVPLREERRNAVTLEAPTGHVAVLGGQTTDGESASTLEVVLP